MKVSYIGVKYNWTKKLSKTQLVHMMECGMTSIEDFKSNRQKQLTYRDGDKGTMPGQNGEPCWDCEQIARDLGLTDLV